MTAKSFLASVAFLILVVYWMTPDFTCGIPHPRPQAILAEIDQLHSSFQAYKEKHLVYPPCMAITDTNHRKVQFMMHLRTVYPSSAYGVRVADFDALNASVASNYQVSDGKGGAIALDLMSLDPAETLVFWLGGFPVPVVPAAGGTGATQPIARERLFGFNRDSDSPMKRSLAQEAADPLATRTNSKFDFREEQLVDNDGDGWLEYVPMPQHAGEIVAPFVYFDAGYYEGISLLTAVPYPTDPKLANQIGTVGPLTNYIDPSGTKPMRWQNPQSFQILCGGLDGKYSAPNAPLRITIFPSGYTYLAPRFNGAPTNYDDEELDNLTNLSRQNLGDARAEVP